MSALDRSTREADVAAAIEAMRRTPERRAELLELLPENVALYDGRSSAEVTRLRGYLLAAFADTGLPPAALPYALEALESSHMPYEVAGAAIALRGMSRPSAGVVPYLVRAVRNMDGADATVTFEGYDPGWPYAQPTTALVEVLRTIAGLGVHATEALVVLERLLANPERYPAAVQAEMRAACAAIRGASDPCCGDGDHAADEHSCCHDVASVEPIAADAANRSGASFDVALEDQDGRIDSFAGYFSGKPSVLSFFYTRCDNPYKCSLTVTKLARLQALIAERGMQAELKLAAITYDPEFDIPARLKSYGIDRGMTFSDSARFFRAASGFSEFSRHLKLGVNYGASTVNRHRIELYVLDAAGGTAASFTRLQWEPHAVLEAAERLLVPQREFSR